MRPPKERSLIGSIRGDISAIRTWVSKIHDAIQEYKESVRAAEERKREDDGDGKPARRVISFDEQTVRDQKEESNRQNSTQNSIKNATWFAVLAACIYATIAAWQGCEMRRTNDAMDRQLDITERPWLSVQVKPQVLNFVNGSQAVFGVQISIANVGKSIAKDILLDIKLFPTSPNVPVAIDAAQNERTLCNPPQPSNSLRFDLFPTDKPEERVMDVSVLPKDVSARSVKAGYPGEEPQSYVGFYVVGCANYHASFDRKLLQTRFAYHLLRQVEWKNDKPPMLTTGGALINGFEVGTNVTGDKIGMMRELLAINDAN